MFGIIDSPRLQAWLAALESDEYKQATGRLRVTDENGPRHCCLGVACDLEVKAGNGAWCDPDTYFYSFRGELTPEVATLPRNISLGLHGGNSPNVVVWAASADESVRRLEVVALTSLNDRGISFKDIARAVRANLAGKAVICAALCPVLGEAIDLTAEELSKYKHSRGEA